MINNSGTVMLSVLMATTPDRNNIFKSLYANVITQVKECKNIHPTLGDVEVIVDDSKSFLNGGLSIGRKRQVLLDRATGIYVCYLDSDDNIAPDYIETILRLAIEGNDILTFNNFSKLEGYWMAVRMTINHPYDEQPRPGIINRRPYHVCAFKKEILKGISFPDLNWDEDTEFIKLALERCKTESHSEAILHQYNRGVRKTENWRKL